jgi:mRNA interferase MazF
MKRGDVVIVSGKRDYGKPRPAIVIQNERLTGRIDSVSVCLMTSDLSNESLLRVTIEPEKGNGLRAKSQVQIEKIMTFPSEKVRGPVGRISGDQLYEVDRGLMFHLDLVQPFEVTRTT